MSDELDHMVGRLLVGSPAMQNISFQCAGHELLRLQQDGQCFVRGEKVDDNQAIWEGFVSWMHDTGSMAFETGARRCECGRRLVFSARMRSDGLCWPCHREKEFRDSIGGFQYVD